MTKERLETPSFSLSSSLPLSREVVFPGGMEELAGQLGAGELVVNEQAILENQQLREAERLHQQEIARKVDELEARTGIQPLYSDLTPSSINIPSFIPARTIEALALALSGGGGPKEALPPVQAEALEPPQQKQEINLQQAFPKDSREERHWRGITEEVVSTKGEGESSEERACQTLSALPTKISSVSPDKPGYVPQESVLEKPPASPPGEEPTITWKDLASLNGIKNPNQIWAGQALQMPDGSTYVITFGDTLVSITKRYNAGTLETISQEQGGFGSVATSGSPESLGQPLPPSPESYPALPKEAQYVRTFNFNGLIIEALSAGPQQWQFIKDESGVPENYGDLTGSIGPGWNTDEVQRVSDTLQVTLPILERYFGSPKKGKLVFVSGKEGNSYTWDTPIGGLITMSAAAIQHSSPHEAFHHWGEVNSLFGAFGINEENLTEAAGRIALAELGMLKLHEEIGGEPGFENLSVVIWERDHFFFLKLRNAWESAGKPNWGRKEWFSKAEELSPGFTEWWNSLSDFQKQN